MTARRQRDNQKGAALVIVLWTALLLSMALAIAIASARIEAQITAAHWEAFAARQAAMDGLEYAAYRIAVEDSGDMAGLSGLAFSINNYDVSFTPAADSEKLDINLAGEPTLASFFLVLGVGPQEAESIAARIADWRDEDDLSRPNGAEARDYKTARNGEHIGNRLFYSVDELKLVLNAPPDIIECALPALTIFGDGTPPSTRLLQTLYGADIERGEAISAARLGTASRSATVGRRYAITATAKKHETRNERALSLTGIFRITGGRDAPFEWIAQFEQTEKTQSPQSCRAVKGAK